MNINTLDEERRGKKTSSVYKDRNKGKIAQTRSLRDERREERREDRVIRRNCYEEGDAIDQGLRGGRSEAGGENKKNDRDRGVPGVK